jgi:hypothetical protein
MKFSNPKSEKILGGKMILDYDFQELRKHVITLEDKIDFLFQNLGITYIPRTYGEDPRILEMLQKGNMTEAIKIYRELYAASLADAKRAVEELQRKHGL